MKFFVFARNPLFSGLLLPLLFAPHIFAQSKQNFAATKSGEVLWSDPATWGGVKPVANQAVTIPSGTTVLLDENPPALGGVTINGTLVFDQTKSLSLSADWIMVHGELRIGSEAEPYTHTATISLISPDTALSVMGMGNRGIMVMGGKLELHGNPPAIPWTKLNAHATIGATQFTLAENTGWANGSRIVIGPTDYYLAGNGISQSQTFVSGIISGTTLNTTSANSAYRWGRLQYVTPTGLSETPGNAITPPVADTDTTFTPLVLDERAPVGNLSRNIVIQAPDDIIWQTERFGVHIMIMGDGSEAHVNGVEIRRGGQAGRLARYPFHWHMLSYAGTQTLNDATGQYFRNSVINESGNRGITIHGTNGVEVSDNILYDIRGHGIFFEDAVERRNTIDGNLILRVRFPANNHILKQHEIGSFGASGMWISNPDNTIINNHVADTEGNGYWMAFPERPFGQSAEVLHTDGQLLQPNRLRFGTFDNNTAHSNRRDGIHIDNPEIDEAGNLSPTAVQYHSTTNGRPISWPVTTLRRFSISRFSVWKNNDHGFWDRAAWTDTFEGVSADNSGRFFAGSGADGIIQRCLVIGTSLNYEMNGTGRPLFDEAAGGNQTPTAFATYHSTFDIRNNIVINFPLVSNTRSGVFATEDYYIRPVDKGHIRNTGNLTINSHIGVKLPARYDYFALAGALWDPNNNWGGTGSNNYFVYDSPFFTFGQSTTPVQPGAEAGGVLVPGPFYGINDFVVNNANDRDEDLMEIRVTRLNAAFDSVGTWSVNQAGSTEWLLAHMRHFAAHHTGVFKLEFPTINPVNDVHFTVENMLSAQDSLILAVEFSAGMQITQAYASTFPTWRSQGVAEYPTDFWGKTIFTQVSSRDALVTTSAQGAYWHDLENNLVWLKMRGGLQLYMENLNQAHLYPETSDEKLYRQFGIRIYGQPKQAATIAGSQGWRLISSPYVSDRMDNFLAPIWTQGAAGSNAPTAAPSVYYYQDSAAKSFLPITNLNANVTSGRGMAVFVFNDPDFRTSTANSGFPQTLYSLGTKASFPSSLPVSFHNSGNLAGDGWNLVGNPDSVQVNWNDDFSRTNIDQTAYFWNNETSDWEFTDGELIRPDLNLIPPFTGFFVKASSTNPVLSYAPAQQKRQPKTVSERPMIKIEMRKGNLKDELWLSFENDELETNATTSTAFALQPLAPKWIQVTTENDGVLFSKSIHKLPATNPEQLDVYAFASESGETNVHFSTINWPAGVQIRIQNLLANDAFYLQDSASTTIELPASDGAGKATGLPSLVHPSVQKSTVEKSPVFTIELSNATTSTETIQTPVKLALNNAYPNPFNPETRIAFELPTVSSVKLALFEMTGRHIRTLTNARMNAGKHQTVLNGTGLASGIYVIVLETSMGTLSQKVTLLK